MTLLRLENLALHETFSLWSNPKNLFIILILCGTLLYILYYCAFQRQQLLHVNLIDNKQNKSISPFHRTLGFIRWNSARLERIPIMEKYRPFFANLHFSIPGYTSKINYTTDGWKDGFYIYKALADTMQIILQNYPTIEGMLYFHFDAWINPLKFNDMNFNKIWFPNQNGPRFKCLTNTTGLGWWAWKAGYHHIAIQAIKNVTKNYPKRFVIDENLFCSGWSDIYYIPRRFFKDFIDLTNIFYSVKTFHEIAIPTMINIIDHTYRLKTFDSIISILKGCWGNCCRTGAKPADLKRKRCGHKMDLSNDDIRNSLIEILDPEVAYLKRSIGKSH